MAIDLSPNRLRAMAWAAGVTLAAALSLPASSGCGEPGEPPGLRKKAVALGSVPSSVGKAAQKSLPDVKFGDAFENIDAEGKLHSYEIRGSVPKTGKIREVRVAPDGKILEVE